MGVFENGGFMQKGLFGQGMMLESVNKQNADADAARQQAEQAALVKDEGTLMMEAVARMADESDRSVAAAAVLEWAKSGDATYFAFDDFALALAEVDDEEPSDEQVEAYNDYLELMAQAAVSFGASYDDVTAMIDDEDDVAAESVMDALTAVDDDEEEEAITAFAIKSDLLLEAKVKVVRDGKVKLIPKKVRKKRLSGAQRSALKKARTKAHTSAAKIARRKSMKIRKKRGM